ncbi:cytochrome c peroxidase [Sulfuritalea sp.]|uniref:cytochrome-c peroxidase n=1 Tax=Sulfuritalea sp. TaxID=2480090 RepID=UPI00286DC7E9|nr:cytochrome c peroxidase [Sulfuritalea sp.]
MLKRLGLAALLGFAATAFAGADKPALTAAELGRIAAHGPWPLPWTVDPGNRVSGNAAAIRLGHDLFFDPRLSANRRVACASCHDPVKGFQDGRRTGRGLVTGTRNTPGLFNLRQQRWFGWDGGHDNLWSASLRPILDPREMGGKASRVARALRSKSTLDCHYTEAFGKRPAASDPELLVNVAKAIASWLETLVSPATPFDEFRAALARQDAQAAAAYPATAQRGLRIFLDRGQCATCHAGPLFSNGEFGDTGLPFFVKPNGVDPGRQGGIKLLLANPYNLLGAHNDDATRDNATGTKHLRPEHRNFGEFKVPSLRNLRLTAPYMHNGSFATLREVVKHYSELDEDRLHADGERILKPLKLSEAESADLVAFLESLSPREAPPAPAVPPAVAACSVPRRRAPP